MVKCEGCGESNPTDNLFCSFCGARLKMENKTAVCPSCGSKIDADSAFCTVCGQKTNSDI